MESLTSFLTVSTAVCIPTPRVFFQHMFAPRASTCSLSLGCSIISCFLQVPVGR
jgi:hypothetical protein